MQACAALCLAALVAIFSFGKTAHAEPALDIKYLKKAGRCFLESDPQFCLRGYLSERIYFPELPSISERGVCSAEFRSAVARSPQAAIVTGAEFLSCIYEAQDQAPLGNGLSV